MVGASGAGARANAAAVAATAEGASGREAEDATEGSGGHAPKRGPSRPAGGRRRLGQRVDEDHELGSASALSLGR
eukprot:4379096-Prymnesium_polylepis.1